MMHLREVKGHDGPISNYIYNLEQNVISKEELRSSKIQKDIVCWLKELFLPQGYPYSVSDDYLEYQIWDSMQAYCSFFANAVSLHTTLEGLGVGNESASSVAAAMAWLFQDGTSIISSIGFAYVKGGELDCNSKQWRLFADVINDFMFFIKLMSPFLPFPFWLTLCFSSILRSFVGIAGSATKATVSQHQALNNNMADVCAKEAVQEHIVNLCGLLTSLTILPTVTASFWFTWISFILSVALHIYCNYRAMKSLKLKSLNRPRFLQILHEFTQTKTIPAIEKVNSEEPLLSEAAFQNSYLTPFMNVSLGGSIKEAINACPNYISTGFSLYQKLLSKYVIFVNNSGKHLYVTFENGTTEEDVMIVFMAAYIFAQNERMPHQLAPEFVIDQSASQKMECALKVATNIAPLFFKKLKEQGWILTPLKLNYGDWRFQMTDKKLT